MASEQLIAEARAKIIWGEPVADVRQFLISNGMSEAQADATIELFNRERHEEIRKIGIKNTVIGAVLVGIGVTGICLIYASPFGQYMKIRSAKIAGVLACVGLFGVWKLINGIIYLVHPQSERKSLTDLSD